MLWDGLAIYPDPSCLFAHPTTQQQKIRLITTYSLLTTLVPLIVPSCQLDAFASAAGCSHVMVAQTNPSLVIRERDLNITNL